MAAIVVESGKFLGIFQRAAAMAGRKITVVREAGARLTLKASIQYSSSAALIALEFWFQQASIHTFCLRVSVAKFLELRWLYKHTINL